MRPIAGFFKAASFFIHLLLWRQACAPGLAGADRRPFGAGLPPPRPIWRGPALALGAYGRCQTFACAKYSCVLVFDEAEPPHRKPWLWPRGHAGPGMGQAQPHQRPTAALLAAPHTILASSSGFWRKSGLLLLGKKISEVPLLEPPGSGSAHRGTSC